MWGTAGDHMMTSSNKKKKHFPCYWPFVRGIHRSPVNSPHKGQWRGAWMFSLICPWTNSWANNEYAGDLKRHGAHYDATVMWWFVYRGLLSEYFFVLNHHNEKFVGLRVNSSPYCRIYASVNRVNIGSDNGLSLIRRQAIVETNPGLLSIGLLGTNFSEIVIKIQNVSFTKRHLKVASAKWQPFCPGRD